MAVSEHSPTLSPLLRYDDSNYGWAMGDQILNTNDNKGSGKKREETVNGNMQSERWQERLMRWGDVLSSRTYTVHIPLRVPLDEVEPRQVNARKRPVSYFPFFYLGICESQMEDLQPVFHLEKMIHITDKEKKKQASHTEKR